MNATLYAAVGGINERLGPGRLAGMLAVAVLGITACDGSGPAGPDAEPIQVRGTLLHVSANSGNNQNDGSADAPYATIGWALDQAQGEATIYVAAGTYQERIVPKSRTHIYGGFDDRTWTRSGGPTIVNGGERAAQINNVGDVSLTGLRLVASDAGRSDPSSIAVTVHNSFGVVLKDNELVAGLGRIGRAGVDRARPSRASGGGDGEDDAICGTDLNKGGSGGGASTARGGGAGGAGKSFLGFGGKDGKGPRGGAGGDRGSADAEGDDGANGGSGSAGADGDGGASFGTVTGGNYLPAGGSSGTNGTSGSGGGGGGAGSGLANGVCGSAGGGGGQGGAGGRAGTGGAGGGGSFGLIVTANSQVTVTGNRIQTSAGGDGGRGGAGAAGGLGGVGGDGGSKLVAGYDGGDGGNGGTGGRGGDGGGGGGGPSIGIATDGVGSVTQSSNTFVIGAAGAGGAADNPGAAGVAAEVHGVG